MFCDVWDWVEVILEEGLVDIVMDDAVPDDELTELGDALEPEIERN